MTAENKAERIQNILQASIDAAAGFPEAAVDAKLTALRKIAPSNYQGLIWQSGTVDRLIEKDWEVLYEKYCK